MANFYFASSVNEKEAVIREDLHHILKVARHRVGERIGILYPPLRGWGRIVRIDKEQVLVELEELREVGRNEREIVLAVPVVKDAAMSEILQHATELGVKKIVIFESKYSRKLKWIKLERLKKIVREAAKQCGNPLLPEIELIDFQKLGGNGVFMDIDGEDFSGYNPVEGENLIVVGPEGGFADEEKKLLENKGLKAVAFGSLILRTETAALVGTTLAKYLWKSFYEEVSILRL